MCIRDSSFSLSIYLSIYLSFSLPPLKKGGFHYYFPAIPSTSMSASHLYVLISILPKFIMTSCCHDLLNLAMRLSLHTSP